MFQFYKFNYKKLKILVLSNYYKYETMDLEYYTKSFRGLEMYVARYIYKKYLENIKTKDDIKYPKYSSKIIDNNNFKVYLDTIFTKQRPRMITQEELLEEEMNDIELADEKYDELKEKSKNEITSESRFPRKEISSYPDTMRCTFIVKRKNKYKRCGNKIFRDEMDTCKLHGNQPNIYWDKYCSLLDE